MTDQSQNTDDRPPRGRRHPPFALVAFLVIIVGYVVTAAALLINGR